MEPFGEDLRWQTDLSPNEALRRAEEVLITAGGVSDGESEAGLRYRFGRPLSWRLWGMWGPRAERRVPFTVVFSANSAGTGSFVSLRADPDTEGYVVALPQARRLWERAVSPIIQSLELAFGAKGYRAL